MSCMSNLYIHPRYWASSKCPEATPDGQGQYLLNPDWPSRPDRHPEPPLPSANNGGAQCVRSAVLSRSPANCNTAFPRGVNTTLRVRAKPGVEAEEELRSMAFSFQLDQPFLDGDDSLRIYAHAGTRGTAAAAGTNMTVLKY